jgi:acetoin utilization protein AcuB
MRLEEIMNRNVAHIDASADVERARSAMLERDLHHLVVLDDGRVVGVLSSDDLAGTPAGSVRDVMTTRIVKASPTTTVREAANLLRGRGVGCLPVLDGDTLVGIVTVADLLDLIGRGVERPVAESKRWTLRRRAPTRKPEPTP